MLSIFLFDILSTGKFHIWNYFLDKKWRARAVAVLLRGRRGNGAERGNEIAELELLSNKTDYEEN